MDSAVRLRLDAIGITIRLHGHGNADWMAHSVGKNFSGAPVRKAARSRQRATRIAAAMTIKVAGLRTASEAEPARRFSGGGNQFAAVEQALRNQQAEAACHEFTHAVQDGCMPSPALCDRLIEALCGRRNWPAARHAYYEMKNIGLALRYGSYQQLMSTAIRANDLGSALDILQDMKSQGLVINRVTYCSLISACGKQRRRGLRYMQIAHELWQELLSSGMQLDGAAFRAGLKACVDLGKQDEAWQVLMQMQAAGEQPDARAYNILLRGHSRSNDAAALDLTLQRMEDADVQPTAVTYNTLIDGYVNSGAVEAAERCAAKAQEGGVQLDAWSYSTLVKGHVQSGNMAAAAAVVETMRSAGVQPNCVTFTTLIDGHVKQGNLAAAGRVLEELILAGERPTVVTYNTLLHGYATQQPAPLQQALALLAEMQQAGVPPSTDTFNVLMSVAITADDPRLCLQLWERLDASSMRPDALTYTCAIQAHARLRQPMEALAVFERLSKDTNAQMDLAAYSALVDALSLSGDMECAERMLKAACSFAQQQGQPPPLEAFGAVVTGYARQLLVPQALATVRRYLAFGGSPDAQMLDQLFDIALRTGEYKVAMQAVRAMELTGQKVDKQKYCALLQQRLPRDAADAQTQPQGQQQTGNQRRQRNRNVHLERLLFWFGLSTRYYDSDDES